MSYTFDISSILKIKIYVVFVVTQLELLLNYMFWPKPIYSIPCYDGHSVVSWEQCAKHLLAFVIACYPSSLYCQLSSWSRNVIFHQNIFPIVLFSSASYSVSFPSPFSLLSPPFLLLFSPSLHPAIPLTDSYPLFFLFLLHVFFSPSSCSAFSPSTLSLHPPFPLTNYSFPLSFPSPLVLLLSLLLLLLILLPSPILLSSWSPPPSSLLLFFLHYPSLLPPQNITLPPSEGHGLISILLHLFILTCPITPMLLNLQRSITIVCQFRSSTHIKH